jgi:transposase InsO family protein
MCQFFGVSRAGYYEWVKRLEDPDPDRERMREVQTVYEASHKTYGYRRITMELQDQQGQCINHKTVLRLMRKLGIRSVARKPFPYRKAEDLGTFHRYPNLLARDFVANAPNQKWVTDITYIRLQQGWAFLSIIKDLYDGFIVGHLLHHRNSIALVTQTLQLAQQNEKVTDRLILHSDQAAQYTSQAYHAHPVSHHPFHVPAGQLLGQCPRRKFLQPAQGRISAPFTFAHFRTGPTIRC